MTDEPKPRNKKRWLLWSLAGVVGLVAICHVPVGRVKIEVGPDTTLIDGPLNDDGTVNYAAALDAAYREGVTRDNNAAYLLLEALGPGMLDEDHGAETLHRLGVGLRPDAKYFMTYEVWAEENPDALGDGPLNSGDDFDPEVIDLLVSGGRFAPVEAWLEYNAAALEVVLAASRKPLLYVPIVSPGEPASLYSALCWNLTGIRGAGRALVARAMVKLRRGEAESAWEDILAVHRLARLMSRDPWLITQLVAISLEAQAARAGAALAARGKLTAEQARAMAADLAALGPAGDVIGQLERSERYGILDVIMEMSRGEPGARRYVTVVGSNLDWNEMCRVVNYWWDTYLDAVRKPTSAERAAAGERWDRDFTDMWTGAREWPARAELILLKFGGWPFRTRLSQVAAELVVAEIMPSLTMIVEAQYAARMRTDLTRVAFTLAAFRAETGRWPAKLAELAPKYIAEIPQDTFNAKTLTYRLQGKGYIVYSVGANGRDDDGVNNVEDSEDEEDEKDDIAVEVK